MKEKSDLVLGWLKKVASDLVAMRASAQAGALDAACFHAQQAAEKCCHTPARLAANGLFEHQLGSTGTIGLSIPIRLNWDFRSFGGGGSG